jgi:hypothetical protein
MFYRLVQFDLGAGKQDAARAIFADLVPKISVQPGCESVSCFGDAGSGKFGFAVLWESDTASVAASSVIGPVLSKHLADKGAADRPFSSELFEVFT